MEGEPLGYGVAGRQARDMVAKSASPVEAGIPFELSNCSKQLSEVEQGMAQLMQRIEPIMGPIPPSTEQEDKRDIDSGRRVTDQLRALRLRIRTISAALQEVHARLEL